MESTKIQTFVERLWDSSAIPELAEFIRIANISPLFDTEWQVHGFMDAAVARFETWCSKQTIADMTLKVIRLPGRTPLIYMDIASVSDDCVLLYGHLDKQPEMTGWRNGLGPWKPVLEGDKLYGRGGADDGYAMFASLIAIQALREFGVPHARCVVIIEACEESGSYDLPHYIDLLANQIGRPSLVICLDSGCGNYDQLWCTTSLRGLIGGTLAVQILTEGVHSGDASGIVPSSFRIVRQLLSRLEDEQSGRILPDAFYVEIPTTCVEQAALAADMLGEAVYDKFPFEDGAKPASDNAMELILNRTWRPALSVVGASGLPAVENAGNVLRAFTGVKLSLRLPPTCDAQIAARTLAQILEDDPPYGARVTFTPDWTSSGWNAPPLAPWLKASLDRASRTYFGKPAVYMGEGGSIPFMGMLGKRFPEAQFLITGLLGPHSNAHGPNEFLHIPTAKMLTCCVAEVLADHHAKGQTP
ncbi:MAG: M20 family metallopeptidase [Gammaproteobacteria bacterium]|nr:M20 family metallopeptidase [Gammaproteobacteria bacterium]MCI0591532.1 M20 family metallopeptidase [Gammaproteobacteria bacterium]